MSDDLEKKLRAAADAAVLGVVMAGAVEALNKLAEEVETGKLTWRDAGSPKGSRGLDGTSSNFKVVVVQYNTGTEIRHSGMAVVTSGTGVNLITMPPDYANWIFHKAQATRN